MFPIKKIPAVITSVTDLSASARAITLTLTEPMPFRAGSFVNIFIPKAGKIERRAFSISSTERDQNQITISVRLNPAGTVSPLFWLPNIVGMTVEVMGPLGLNTADKMLASTVHLFGFGVGAGVIKSLADHFINQPDTTKITIMTGNRSDLEILHKDYFDSIATNPKVSISYVVSQPLPLSTYPAGYIQDHIDDLDFNDSLVYICGQEIACNTLVQKIKTKQPHNCQFFIEGFH